MRKHLAVGVAAAALFLSRLQPRCRPFNSLSTQNQHQCAEPRQQPAAQAPQAARGTTRLVSGRSAPQRARKRKNRPSPQKFSQTTICRQPAAFLRWVKHPRRDKCVAGETDQTPEHLRQTRLSSSDEKAWRAKFATLRAQA